MSLLEFASFRALSFVRVLLTEVLGTSSELSECAYTAYEQTLRKYHNFLVKGIFSVCTLMMAFLGLRGCYII